MKKKYWTIVYFLLFGLTLQVKAYPKDTYFDFNFPSKLLLINHDYKIEFSFLISGASAGDFTVRPVMENGTLEIYDEEKDLWIKQTTLRSSFPKLTSEMKVRITSFGGSRSGICFEIQHIKTANNYKTPCKTYWNRLSLERYINLINDKILKWTG